jgi:hypothetical protein
MSRKTIWESVRGRLLNQWLFRVDSRGIEYFYFDNVISYNRSFGSANATLMSGWQISDVKGRAKSNINIVDGNRYENLTVELYEAMQLTPLKDVNLINYLSTKLAKAKLLQA